MNEALEQALLQKYPRILAGHPRGLQPSPGFRGFEHDDGWMALLESGLELIQWHTEQATDAADDPVPAVTVQQVKEKFGSLRFYYSGGDAFVAGVVAMMTAISLKTCEICGDAGQCRGREGNVKTLCPSHAEQLNYF